jgi:hypothetical protein
VAPGKHPKWQYLLKHGATGQLPVEALPLGDEELLDLAKPETSDGEVTVEARHEAEMRSALGSGPCSLLILGGAPDLTAAVRRLGNGEAEYIRVATSRLLDFSGVK